MIEKVGLIPAHNDEQLAFAWVSGSPTQEIPLRTVQYFLFDEGEKLIFLVLQHRTSL